MSLQKGTSLFPLPQFFKDSGGLCGMMREEKRSSKKFTREGCKLSDNEVWGWGGAFLF